MDAEWPRWNRQYGTDGFCGDCEWYEGAGGDSGTCHGYGPILGGKHHSAFPSVADDDWCPKWERRRVLRAEEPS